MKGFVMHKKHADIARPEYGVFSRREFAIIGAPCGLIQDLAEKIAKAIGSDFRLGYVDADHSTGEGSSTHPCHDRVYTDKIGFHRLDFGGNWNTHQYRMWFNDQDLVLVNGNHFKASRQIVVVDPAKRDSLERKLSRLTDVGLFLLGKGETEIWPYLKSHVKGWEEIPVLSVEDTTGIAQWIQSCQQPPRLNGLVLAGGRSTRMGRDKGSLEFYGKPQREYMADMLQPYCKEVYLSVRPDQEVPSTHPLIADTFFGLGPFGALLSAFRSDPDAAWIVVACDLPLLGDSAIRQLVESRDARKVATAFRSPVNDFPEPLIAIWEPKAYLHALAFLSQGYSCPRKVLINSEIRLVEPNEPLALTNVNTPDELDEVTALMKKGK